MARRVVLVCGGRDLKDEPWVYSELASFILPSDRVIHGDANGADRIAGGFAKGLGREVQAYPADWEHDGRSAGPRRNARMLRSEELRGHPVTRALVFPGGRGTADMVKRLEKAEIPIRFAKKNGPGD